MILDFSQNNIFAVFEITKDNHVALKHFSSFPPGNIDKNMDLCLLSDIHISGGDSDERFGAKHMGESEYFSLKYKQHRYYENAFGKKLEFLLGNEKTEVVAHFQFYDNISAVRAWKTITNISDEPIGLAYVSSFSYTGLDEEKLKILIPHNSWCRELVWREYTLSDLGLCNFTTHASDRNSTKRISVSNTGTDSAKEYLPMAAAVGKREALLWQIENNGSWQWEISDTADSLYLKMGGPNEQENFWYKELKPGDCFESVKACVSLGGTFDEALGAMTEYRRKIFHDNEENKKLPIVFNDYMHCLWADPTEEKSLALIDSAAELGCEYYCMDAGWYADGGWWDFVGVWEEQKKRFPNGIKKVFDYAKSKGMIPGIWLEIEVMGINCPILDQFEDECFFMRHGKRVVNRGRYQFDFRNEKVRDFATSVIKRVVEEYGVGYIKMDYNIDGGAGTEVNADSFGDGLLEHNRAYLAWIREIKEKYPALIIENCSSGGMRMDYAMLSEHHLQSITDQETFQNLAYIAGAAPTAVLPEQAAVWVYPKENDSADETAFMMVSALLQRVYLSGQADRMSEEKKKLIKEGLELYKKIRCDISAGLPFYPLGIPQNGQSVACLGFEYKTCKRIAVWHFGNEKKEITISAKHNSAQVLYPSNTKIKLESEKDNLKITFPPSLAAAIIEIN